jgi:hypothetical protein
LLKPIARTSPPPDTGAFALLDVPVAWVDAQGRLRGANAAFGAATGLGSAAIGLPLAPQLGLLASDATATLLARGEAFAPRPALGQSASGAPLRVLLGARAWGALRVVTLQRAEAVDTTPGSGADTGQHSRRPADLPRGPGLSADDGSAPPLARSVEELRTHLHLAVTLADIGIWRHDRASGQVQLNDQCWALLGLAPRPDGMTMTALLALLHPDDQAAVRRQVRADWKRRRSAEADGPVDLSARWRHADGRWHYLLTRRVMQRDTQGRLAGYLGVALNLSGRFSQQQRTLALAQRLEMATAAAGVGVWSALMGHPPTAHWNDEMRTLHGLAADAPAPLWSDYIARHVHPADRQATAEAMATLLQRREGLLDMDLRIVRPDGTVRRLATRSSVGGPDGARYLHGVMLDMTERHATEDRLRQANERAALAARGAGIGTWESPGDTLTGLWDEQMFRLRGRDPIAGPVTQEMMMAWVHPADREPQLRRMNAAMRNDVPTHSEFRVVLPDGSVRWLASRATPVRDEQGRTVRRIGINWDVTDARNAAAEREERQLAQRENQAKSRLLARVSHELRTPLNAVLGFTQLMLADERPDPATWRRQVAHVQASGEHLLALIDDVLELSSLESGELPMSLQPVALRPLVETSLPLVEMLTRRHGVTMRLGELSGWALADPVRLRQVLLNLLSNAIKYNRPGGQVTVSALPQAGWLLLRVEDTGQGMSEQHLRHLFEPFNRLGREGDDIAGTGIGLAIVHAAVQQMGGGVQVRSTPGQGSCFELNLQMAESPQAPPQHAAPAQVPVPTPPLPAGGLVVYIEDNELNLLIVEQMMLRRPDLHFDSAPDGKQGLALVRARKPALLLLDMQLPDIDGHEVLQRLRAEPDTAGIHCIALSANAMPEDIRRAREAGCADYWTKPLDLRAFMASLDALFGPAPG